jgi:hypothetical protein
VTADATLPDGKPKPFVFAVMPFHKDFDDVYRLGIKGACEDAGAYCERVDEQIFDERMIERIYNQINKADIVVAELSARNANVFYETGYARGLGKHVVLIARSEDDIPLDLGQHAHVVYGDSLTGLKEDLAKRLRWAIEHPDRNPAQVEFVLGLHVGGKPLKDTPAIEAPMLMTDQGGGDGFTLRIDVHNGTERPFSKKLGIGVAVEELNQSESGAAVVTLPDKRFLHLQEQEVTVMPGCWDSLEWVLKDRFRHYSFGVEFEAEVLVYAEFGTFKYPLRVKCIR